MAFCREGKALGEVHLELEWAKTAPRVQIYLTQRYQLPGRLRCTCGPLPRLSLKGELLEKLTVVRLSLQKNSNFPNKPRACPTHVDTTVKDPWPPPARLRIWNQDICRGNEQHEPKFPAPEASTRGWQQIRQRRLNVMALKWCLLYTRSLKHIQLSGKSWDLSQVQVS